MQDNGEPTLKRIARQGERERTQITAVLKLNIMDLDNFLHLKNKLTESEVDFIAGEVLEDYGHGLTMADVMLIIKKAKKGGYGKFYERLSAPDIMQWFDEYFSKRLDTSEDYNRRRDEGFMMINSPRSSATVTIEDGGYLNYKLHLANNNYKLQEQ